MRCSAFAIGIVACLAVARTAHAEERGVVVIVGASEGDPIVLKVSDELRVLGFDVEVAPLAADRARIQGRAKAGDSVAVILVNDRDIEVRVVTSERVHERRVARRATDPSTSALEAVEVIRGYLVPVDPTAAAPTPIAPAPTTGEPKHETPRSYSTRLSGGFLAASSFPTLASLTLGGAKHFGRLAIEVAAVGTLPRADGWSGGLDVAAHFAPLGQTRPVSFAVGVGMTGLAVAYREDAKKYSIDVAAVPHVVAIVRARIASSFHARIDGTLGASTPSPRFKSKTGSDIEFGSLVTNVSAGLEVSW